MESTLLKSSRLLWIYTQLIDGKVLSKKDLAQQFQVTERSIQRDIESLRCFFAEQELRQEVVYNKELGGYLLCSGPGAALSNSEILAACKILLESRSLRRDEMFPLLDKLVENCIPEQNKRAVRALIANEKYHYIEPRHQRRVLDGLWEIAQALENRHVLEIQYERMKEPKLVTRILEPAGLLFSEYYFYLAAFLRNVDREAEFENAEDRFPTIYRIDRIRSFKVLSERFRTPYRDRFEEGEFRKRVQFMYGGRLEKLRFRYTGPSIEAVLDRLPTACIIGQNSSGWRIEAEVFGKGIEMWLKSQGNMVTDIEVG